MLQNKFVLEKTKVALNSLMLHCKNLEHNNGLGELKLNSKTNLEFLILNFFNRIAFRTVMKFKTT